MSNKIDIKESDALLKTTRSVRLRLDFAKTVPDEVIKDCITVALQAPSQTNTQQWHFVVVTDRGLRERLGDIYRDTFDKYWAESAEKSDGSIENYSGGDQRMIDSAVYLRDNFHKAPAHVLFCATGNLPEMPLFEQASAYGSIMPAAWSFMLAARSRGLGTCWTSVHLKESQKVADVLNLPDNLTQAVLMPVAYYSGSGFREASRLPLDEVLHWNGW